FFFQAEDGIRDFHVTGVQTCALPIYREGNETGVYVYNGSVANKALELLGKHMGMFTDKHELTGKDGGPIETRDATFDEMSTEELAKLAVRLADGDGDEG